MLGRLARSNAENETPKTGQKEQGAQENRKKSRPGVLIGRESWLTNPAGKQYRNGPNSHPEDG